MLVSLYNICGLFNSIFIFLQSSGEIGCQSKEFSEVETQTSEIENLVPESSNPLEDPKFYKFIMAAGLWKFLRTNFDS